MSWGQLIGMGINSIWDNLRYERTRSDTNKRVDKDAALQREFAQHGIRWRVRDARKAGLHPLAALGASGAAYSSPGLPVPSPPSMHFDKAGFEIDKALDKSGQRLRKLQEENLDAQTKYIQAKTNAITTPETDTAPIPGQTNWNDIFPTPSGARNTPNPRPQTKVVPSEIKADIDGFVAGSIPRQQWSHRMVPGKGRVYSVVRSDELAQRLEEAWLTNLIATGQELRQLVDHFRKGDLKPYWSPGLGRYWAKHEDGWYSAPMGGGKLKQAHRSETEPKGILEDLRNWVMKGMSKHRSIVRPGVDKYYHRGGE